MIENNIKILSDDMEKLASQKINMQMAERLSILYNAKKALETISNDNAYKNTEKQKNTEIDGNKGITKEITELNDIMPALKEYLQVKKTYNLHKTTQEEVQHTLHKLVVEINEFLILLYANTTSDEERDILNTIKIKG